MKRVMFSLLLVTLATPSFGSSPLRIYVNDFNALGMSAKEDTRTIVQALMASRLTNEKLLTVSSPKEADVIVTGTYVAIGKHYNLDAFAKTVNGTTISHTEVHGEGGQEALFGAIGSLADKLSTDLLRQRTDVVPYSNSTLGASKTGTGTMAHEGIKAISGGNLQRKPHEDIVRPASFYHGATDNAEIKRLDGTFNLLAVGKPDANGQRELFLAQNRAVKFMHTGDEHPMSGFRLPPDTRIIGLDYVDADGSGKQELYVTAMRGGGVASQIWELRRNRLVKVADDVPYFFRSIALAGEKTKLYAQEQGQGENQFYGDVYEVTHKGSKIIRKASVTMPRFGNIYSFNQFKAPDGALLTVVYHPDNYLIVYDKEQHELWRSNDAFGGSELYYQVEDLDNVRTTGDQYRWVFINQPIQVTAKQEILVGKNDGFFVLGTARMYKRGAVYSLLWNGAALEETWRTKETQNYMPDFYFDETGNELFMLQLTQRADSLMSRKGTSALQIKKVE